MLLALTKYQQPAFATLDPGTIGNTIVGSEGILSNGNLSFTVTQANQAAPMSACSSKSLVRKCYWESTATFSVGSESICPGLWVDGTGAQFPSHTNCSNRFPGGTGQSGCSGPFYGDGTYYRLDVVLGTIGGGVPSGTIMGHRFDPLVSGSYDITLDGSTYTNIFSFTPIGTFFGFWVACGCFRNTSLITFNFGASPFHFSVPSGYAAGVF